jgi:hypothetical protein
MLIPGAMVGETVVASTITEEVAAVGSIGTKLFNVSKVTKSPRCTDIIILFFLKLFPLKKGIDTNDSN